MIAAAFMMEDNMKRHTEETEPRRFDANGRKLGIAVLW